MIRQTHTPSAQVASNAPHTLATTFGAGFAVPSAGAPLGITFSQANPISSYDFGQFPGTTWNFGFQSGLSFAGTDMSHGTIAHASFFQCDFSYANLTNCSFESDESHSLSIEYSSLSHADCTGSTFVGSGVQDGFDLHFNDCTGTIFRNCVFTNVAFSGGGFIGADFTGATFVGCTFGTDVNDVYIFDNTTIWPAGFDTSVFPATRSTYYDFSGQVLTGTDLSNTFLGHARFVNSTLQDVDLSQICTWANFQGAKLLGKTFGTARSTLDSFPNLAWAMLKGATIDFGPNESSHSGGGGIVLPIAAHADFSNVVFTWSGSATFPDDRACAFYGANYAYANFNNITRPADCLLVWIECNMAHASFQDANIGPIDSLVNAPLSTGRSYPFYAYPDSNFCYADFTGAVGGWFNMCDLSFATFTNANMPFTCFQEACIGYADFTGAILTQNGMNGSLGAFSTGRQPAVPALYNGHTIVPSNIDLSGLRLASTGQTDNSAFLNDDDHQDFSNQTIDPAASNNIGHFLSAFGADFNHAHFLGVSYANVDAYNSNFEGAVFDSGFSFQSDPPSLSFQSHFGGPALLARGVAEAGSPSLAVRQPTAAIHVPSVTSLTTSPR